MPQSLVQKIQEDRSRNSPPGSAYFLIFFKENATLFDSITSFESEEDLVTYIGLTWSYMCALIDEEHYLEVVERTVKSLAIIDKAISTLPDFEKDQVYHDLLFFEGKARFLLKDYRGATQIFKRLLKSDTQNEHYAEWFNSSLYYQCRLVVRIIYIISAILIFSEVAFKTYFSPFMRLFVLFIGMFGFIGSLIYHVYIKRNMGKTTL